jgi:hypothetical protein
VVAGDMITTIVTARGTHCGKFLGIPATGKQVQFMVIGLDGWSRAVSSSIGPCRIGWLLSTNLVQQFNPQHRFAHRIQ